MKIGILTLPPLRNYGGILQAYALQVYLQRMGHEVWVLNRERKVRLPVWRLLLGTLKRGVLKYVFGRHIALTLSENRRQSDSLCRNTREFVSRYIHLAPPAYTSEDLAWQVSEFQLDAVVVGSDQVWRPGYVASVTDYFLGFLSGISSVKRIAYAASFGVDAWEFTEEQTQNCRSLIKCFDAISVRESSGISLCERYLGVKACHLPDPTLLLRPEDYLDLLEDKTEDSPAHLLVYILDPSVDKQLVVDQAGEHCRLEPYQIRYRMEDSSLPLTERIIPSVEDWLCGFRDAGFVVTDSFHGCVFSILFHKPFIVYGNQERGMARFHSLLSMFQLEDRLIYSAEELTKVLLKTSIDWEKVNQMMNLQRVNSTNFFVHSL